MTRAAWTSGLLAGVLCASLAWGQDPGMYTCEGSYTIVKKVGPFGDTYPPQCGPVGSQSVIYQVDVRSYKCADNTSTSGFTDWNLIDLCSPAHSVQVYCGDKCFPRKKALAKAMGAPCGNDPSPDACVGDPVDLVTGYLEQLVTDIDLGNRLGFTRFYSSGRTNAAGQLITNIGRNWKHNLQIFVSRQTNSIGMRVIAIRPPFDIPQIFTKLASSGFGERGDDETSLRRTRGDSEVGTTLAPLSWRFDGPTPGIPIGVVLGTIAGLALLSVPAVRRRPKSAVALVALAAVAGGVGVARSQGGGASFHWIHTDHLGTPLAVTSTPASPSLATTVWRVVYSPFGETATDEDPDGDLVQVSLSLRLPGQVDDVETGLHYNYFRSYDARVGRYIEADPIGQAGGVRLYAYASDRPSQRADRLGLFSPFTSIGDVAAEFYLGYLDLDRNRRELVDTRQGRADKYFHCKGHCEACKEGPGGELISQISSPGKEIRDYADGIADGEIRSLGQAIGAAFDAIADIDANEAGQAAAARGDHCAGACMSRAPSSLPYRYASEAPRR